MIQTAIILAAGQGKRFKDLPGVKHKCLVPFHGVSLIELSITKLLKSGVKRIVIVLGFESSEIRNELKSKFDQNVFFVENENFDSAGNLFSLIKGVSNIEENCLVLDADILYETQAVEKAILCENKNGIVTTSTSNSGDEVFVMSEAREVKMISKTIDDTNEIDLTEYVGIAFLNTHLVNYIKKVNIEDYVSFDYESFINKRVLQDFNFQELFIPNLVWSEVDSESDYSKILNWSKQMQERVIVS